MLRKFLLTSLIVFAFPVHAEMTHCKLTYSLRGWSFLYRDYSGTGTVVCANGEQAQVTIRSRGGGISFGKSEIDHGEGKITSVKNLQEVYGSYAYLQGHIGATKSVEGVVLTKGEVSLALSGSGRGIDVGMTIGRFTISPLRQ